MTMPINLREGETGSRAGNQFAPARFKVPIGIVDARERMRAIHQRVAAQREEPALALTEDVSAVISRLPRTFAVDLLRLDAEGDRRGHEQRARPALSGLRERRAGRAHDRLRAALGRRPQRDTLQLRRDLPDRDRLGPRRRAGSRRRSSPASSRESPRCWPSADLGTGRFHPRLSHRSCALPALAKCARETPIWAAIRRRVSACEACVISRQLPSRRAADLCDAPSWIGLAAALTEK